MYIDTKKPMQSNESDALVLATIIALALMVIAMVLMILILTFVVTPLPSRHGEIIGPSFG
jgi:hypothetical protein